MTYSNSQINGIRTSEGTIVEFDFAGIGSRVVAYLADWLILLVAWFVVAFVLTYTGLFAEVFIGGDTGTEINKSLLALLIILFYFGNWWYFAGFETVWKGQTPGKRLVGIRVITDNGNPISFGHAAMRTTMRIADFLPFAYGFGVITMFATAHCKRIGDMVAGTVVVREARNIKNLLSEPMLSPEALARPVDERLFMCAQNIGDSDFAIIHEYLLRRNNFTGKARRTLSRKIVAILCSKSPVLAEIATALEAELMPEQFLEDVYRAAVNRGKNVHRG